MKVILLKDIKGVGRKFDEKEVSNGYATNFLIPRRMAVSLAGSSAASIKTLKEQEEKVREKKEKTLAENISKISSITITTKVRANDKGHLFASISKEKISDLLQKENVEIDLEHINITEPIKEIGTFEVPVSVGEGREIKFTLKVERND